MWSRIQIYPVNDCIVCTTLESNILTANSKYVEAPTCRRMLLLCGTPCKTVQILSRGIMIYFSSRKYMFFTRDKCILFLKIIMNFGHFDLWPFHKFSFNICVNNLFFILKPITWSNLHQANIFSKFSGATCGHLSFDKLIRVEHITIQFPLSVYRMYPLNVVYFYSDFA